MEHSRPSLVKQALPTHGVLIQLNQLGIFIVGPSGIGKSEIALQLLYENALFICDDAPDFRLKNKQVIGSCPKGFYALMHIHDLGIINLSEIIGTQSILAQQTIHLVIQLKPHNSLQEKISQQHSSQLLTLNQQSWYYQDCIIPGICLHLYPNRSITTIIKTAIKHFTSLKDKHLL